MWEEGALIIMGNRALLQFLQGEDCFHMNHIYDASISAQAKRTTVRDADRSCEPDKREA